MSELAGTAEIAAMTGRCSQAVSKWAARRESNGFPQPVVTLKMGPVYDAAEVRAWLKTWTNAA